MKYLIRCFVLVAFAATALSAAEASKKNWTPPAYKMYAQVLSEQIMASHPELLSVTFHGVPPGLSKVYTMFAGSYVDRIGNPDDPDDVMITELGITIVDSRWHRTKDAVRKFVMMMPLRDASGESVGLLVLAYKNPVNSGRGEREYFVMGCDLRDALQKQIPSYAALYEPAK
ncbi:MAG: hypothetical protein ACHQ5A_05255 [Opitutales bacterium]